MCLKAKVDNIICKTDANKETISENLSRLTEELEALKCGNETLGSVPGITTVDWRQQKIKTDDLCERMYGLERRSELATKHRNKIDSALRKANIIIDRLQETQNENVIDRINGILSIALSKTDRDAITVINAYRLGRARSDNTPRKIMVELIDTKCRDLILRYAKAITKVGNNGVPYYINEDTPEALKRLRTDQFKYKRYLEERNHIVEQTGDYFIIDGQRHHWRDLNRLPVGMRLMDSRTIFSRGTVAFQSALSPLSNLFPCRIKYNGLHYSSAEQAFQYAKAIHHGLALLAKDIKSEIDPHEIMTMGNSVTIDEAWANKRVEVLEAIVRHKADQVGVFYEYLKQTGNHRLVENTSSDFWGSACAFKSQAVWNGSYRGLNQMGRILERVRDSV